MKEKIIIDKAIVFFLFTFLILGIANAQKPVDKILYTVVDDFETGELFSWEPYPYSQDIGFDALFSARNSPTFHNSKYSIARPVKAADGVELNHGFTKRLDLFTTAATTIKLAVYLQSDRNAKYLELSLGTFDGKRYMHLIAAPKANEWITLNIPASQFKMDGISLQPAQHIQVVTVKAGYEIVNYQYTYTILMDDFSINGERQRQFVAQHPASTDLDKFGVFILNKHFFFGDKLSLTATAEKGNSLKQVKARLTDSRGTVVADNISFSKQGNGWSNESIHQFTDSDLPGQWKIELSGETKKGSTLQTAFNFLMPGKHISAHPRLFFSAGELRQRLANEKSSVAKNILDKAVNDSSFLRINVDAIQEGEDRTKDNLVGNGYAKATGSGAPGEGSMNLWLSPMETLGAVIQKGSFRYAFTHDAASGAQAKKALLKACSFSKWNNNWMLERKFWTYYPVGYILKNIAYGYDMLFDLLTPQEQAFVRDAIMNKGLKLFHRDMVEMNRMPSNVTNHIAVIVTGFGLAATAIYGDDPTNPALEPYISGIMTKTKTFIDRAYYPDGSYAEPKSSYMDMATRDIAEILASWERNFGVDYSTTTNVGNFYKYPLQASLNSGLLQSFGDAERHYQGFTQPHVEWFVKRTGNPYLYNYLKPFWESGRGGYLGYLWFRDDIVPAKKETLPVSKVFSAQGMVMRSGWDDAGTVVTTRAGPNSNHYHYDQGSFQVMTNGTELLTDPGIGSQGYYANLEYQLYNIQAVAHNVLLVDHDPESQVPADYDNGIVALRNWPRMLHSFAGRFADASESSLASVYKNKLKSYTRTLLFTKSGPLFVFDQVQTEQGQPHVLDWLFHAPQNDQNRRSISYANQRMTIDRPSARLTMDVISPVIASTGIRDRYDKQFAESFISLSTKLPVTEANFFAVIYPEAKPGSGEFGPRPKTTRVDGKGWLGARVEDSTTTYSGFFKINTEAASTVEGVSTDATRFTVSYDKNQTLQTAYFEGTSFRSRSLALKTTAPITCALSLKKGLTEIELQSDTAHTLSMSLETKPGNVLTNGIESSNWNYDTSTKLLTIKLAAGRQEIAIP